MDELMTASMTEAEAVSYTHLIDMNEAENRQKLYERMCANMQKDRARHNILPLSKFGLMQIRCV